LHIVSVGRISKEKGFDIAIQIMKKIHIIGYNNVKLSIIGSGILSDTIEKLIEENNLQYFIKIIPYMTQKQLINKYSLSDIFLLCSRKTENSEETQGIVIQEAQATQLPVVVSNIGGISEGIMDGQTGFLCEEDNVDDFVKKLLPLFENKELRETLGKAGRDFIINNFNQSKSADKLDFLYKSLHNV